jgi:Tol biopolymer transport system component
MVAFIVSSVTLADTQLWVRSLDSLTARRLEEGDGGALPFWSPDSKRIGFFSSDKLKTVSASGGRAEILCEVKDARGGAWSSSNVILFAPDAGGPLYRIPASGGTPTPATALDPALKEYGHRFPTFLPDGIHFLFAALPGEAGKFRIFSGSLGDSSRTLVGTLDSAPAYADPGWLLYVRQGILAAHRFDPEARQLTGEAILLADEPTTILDPAVALTAGRTVSPSRTGALAYFTTPSSNMIATWYDAAGRATGTVAIPPGQYESASIAPDGTRAVFVRSTSASESALWLVDLARGSASPSLSNGAGRNDSPVWSPDGTRVVFAADRDGPQDLFVKRVDEAAPEEPLYRSAAPFKRPLSWSPDGHWIIMSQLDAATAQNVWRISASGSPDAQKLVETRGRDIGGPVSPDGRWLAYVSDETGRYQLSIQSFPEPSRRIQVSQQGASRTWWTRDGRQLLFLDERMERLWRVDVEPGASPRLGRPAHIATLPPNNVWVDASPDRTRFLAIAPERTGPGAITIVHNWLLGVPK